MQQTAVMAIGYIAMQQRADDVCGRADMLLLLWSQHARGAETAGLGYPSASIEHSAIYGGGGTPPEWPAEVRAIERTICAMPDNLRKVVKLHYLGRRSRREIARQIKSHHTKVSMLLQDAHMFVLGRLCCESPS